MDLAFVAKNQGSETVTEALAFAGVFFLLIFFANFLAGAVIP